jgi:hypothetical protein
MVCQFIKLSWGIVLPASASLQAQFCAARLEHAIHFTAADGDLSKQNKRPASRHEAGQEL